MRRGEGLEGGGWMGVKGRKSRMEGEGKEEPGGG